MLEKIIEKSNILISKVNMDFVRDVYNEIDFSQKLVGIVGQRGVGKTTLILQYLKNNPKLSSMYFSADNVNIINLGLYNIIEKLYFEYKINVFAIDEIHKYQNWNQELKNIYDDFVNINIIFSGSSSIDLIKGKYDLSRRLTLYKMNGFSFREYINKTKNLNLQKISLNDLVNNSQEISKDIYQKLGDEILFLFRQYLEVGYYPFNFESENKEIYFNKLIGVIDKLIYEDISNFYKIDSLNLEKLRKIIIFYAFSAPGELSINALKQKLQLAYDTTVNYLEILQEVGLLRGINTFGVISKSIRKAKKIFIDNSNIIYAIQSQAFYKIEIGVLREIFFVNQFGNELFFSDNGGDFTILGDKNYIFEVGGKNKTKKQIKNLENSFIVSDDIIFAIQNKIPLWLFGFLK
ncbi:MAG: AAA family ATPase [Candidatus Gracilibacteria bacterium]|nr:AAA family ATPase [Candidatus Gracilibacteria bacterium]